MKLVILDRDGVINQDSDQFVKNTTEWKAIPGSLDAIAKLNHAGYRVVVASNQSGIGRGLLDMGALNAINDKMYRALAQVGGRIDALFYCPHAADSNCDCRKPKPGMLLDVLHRYGVGAADVPVVGDTLRDLQAAHAAGCEPHFVLSGRARGMAGDELQQLLGQVPRAQVHDSLAAFADFLLERDHVVDSASGGLS